LAENTRGFVSHTASQSARPPLWLASAATVAAWAAIYDIGVWVVQFARQPVHPDFRIFYVAAEAGLRHGWASIYDVAMLRTLSKSLPPGQDYITSALPFIHPPLLAWLVAPLTLLPLGVAYAVWCAVLLAALVLAWYVGAPYSGLRKVALLLLALLVAAWWLCGRERPLAAGAALALATALKPHTVILVPLALAASGRYRPLLSWAAISTLLAAIFALALGPAGLNNWWQALVYGQTDPGQSLFTLAYLFGSGPLSYALEALQGAAALMIARRRRDDVNVVFAAGIVGSLAFAFHLHPYDYIELILAAWLVLRSAPPMWHRLWLLAGAATLIALDLGQPVPQLAWDLGWLVILWTGDYARRTEPSSVRVQSGL
jgi:hypothetical protein